MDDVTVLLARARSSLAAAASALATARHASWQGVHADSYRRLLETQAERLTLLEREAAGLRVPPPAP